MVRGLALRSLTGLRLLSVLEYVLTPLKAALTDSSGYVRGAAAIGVLKVHHLSPAAVKDGDFVEALYGMMRDREPQVVINCILSLNEILAERGNIVRLYCPRKVSSRLQTPPASRMATSSALRAQTERLE